MADNYAATQGAGTTFAADDVGGILYPRVKLALGADAAADMDVDSGQQLMASSVPVTVASDQPSEVAIGTTADAAVTTDTTGTLSGKLRGLVAHFATLLSRIPAALTASGNFKVAIEEALPAGTNAIGKLAANSGVDIGDVDVTSLPALAVGTNIVGVVGIDQTTPGTTNGVQVNAAIPAGTNAIGKLAANSGVDIGDVDVLSIAAGTNIIGSTMDAGPAQTITRTYTTSADMTTAANISPAPTAGQKVVATDIMVSTDTAMEFSIQEETSATVFASVFLAANSTVIITLHGFIKAAVADMHLQGKASLAGNVRVTVNSFSEA